MIEHLRGSLLRLLRVPPSPCAPNGAPGSLRVFRAGKRFYQLRLAVWAFAQIAAFTGILFSLSMIRLVRTDLDAHRAKPVATTVQNPEPKPSPVPSGTRRVRREKVGPREAATQVANRLPWWAFPLVTAIEIVVLLGFLISLPFTYAAVRLDYELRWYLVTDRSLRIREGLWGLHEMTMSFANLQQVVVSQGPLQRLLGVADVRVQSAGGGGDESASHKGGPSLHTGVFHGVDNASEIRDLILERLRQFREDGLGDPDEISYATTEHSDSVNRAAEALLLEARALRAALTPADPRG